MIDPHLSYALLAMAVAAAAGAVLWRYTAMHPLWIYLTALTLVTFAFFGFDKHRAIRGRGRIPEAVLHLLALAGGSLGALAGQILFRHKIRKLYFTAILAMIVAVQLGCIAWWIYRTRATG